MELTFIQKIMLASKVFVHWEVLVTLGGFIFIWIILRSVANPDEKKPKPIRFQQKKKVLPVAAKEPESEDEKEDDSPRSRRAAAPEDDADEELVK